jgi:hypothetical protein
MFSLMKRLKFLTGLVRQRSVLIVIMTLSVILLCSVGVHYFEQQPQSATGIGFPFPSVEGSSGLC